MVSSEHRTVQVELIRRVQVDAAIAPEIVWLNQQGVVSEGCCDGPPSTAMIRPSSAATAQQLGYAPVYHEDVGLFEIVLKNSIPCEVDIRVKEDCWQRLDSKFCGFDQGE